MWLARDLIRLWPWLLPVVLLLITFGPAGFHRTGSQPGAAAAALGVVWMTFLITRRLWGHYRAHAAATMLMFTLGVFAFGWLPMPDMTLCFLNLAAIAALVHQRALGFFMLLLLGCVVKGPVAVLVPAMAAMGWWLAGGRREGRSWLPGTGIALVVSLAALVVKAASASPTLTQTVPEGSWWRFVPMLFLALMPWSFCTPRVIRQGWRRLRARNLQARHGLLAGWLMPALALTPGGLTTSALLLVPALVISFCPPLADARRLWRIGATALTLWFASGLVLHPSHAGGSTPSSSSAQAGSSAQTVRELAAEVSQDSFRPTLSHSLPISHTPADTFHP